ncbi:hypothetical protein F5Y14DRAFT_449935 [Nemania sp. NC0429]|nr:hypothetical protein F5Y14DRAFT_449935 [Nemania sp. NC0429]
MQPAHSPSGLPGDVFIGIDFGTTGTAVAFACGGPVAPQSIMWPQVSAVKMPTAIRVEQDGSTSLGMKAPLGPGVAKWFKLSLLHRDSLPVDVRNSPKLREAEEIREQLGMTAVQATSKFLTHVWSDSLKFLPSPAWRFDSINVSMTLPATWPNDARLRFEDAISRSSMASSSTPLNLTFLSEAEAAVLAMDEDVKKRLQVQDIVTVCDCGGGTVDVTTYEILSISPLTLREYLPGEIVLCGGEFVDDGFAELFKSKLVKVFENPTLETMDKAVFQRCMENWWERSIKSTFGHTWYDQQFVVPRALFTSPDKARAGVRISFGRKEIEGVYEPFIKKIRSIIQSQIDLTQNKGDRCKFVYLTGGFSLSDYLRQQLQATLKPQVLWSGMNLAFSGVSIGGAINAQRTKGHPMLGYVRLDSRVCRSSYRIRGQGGRHHPYSQIITMGEDMPAHGGKRVALRDHLGLDGRQPSEKLTSLDIFRVDRSQGSSIGVVECQISWKSAPDLSLLSSSPSVGRVFVELEATYTGYSMEFAVYHNGALQDQDCVVIRYV